GRGRRWGRTQIEVDLFEQNAIERNRFNHARFGYDDSGRRLSCDASNRDRVLAEDALLQRLRSEEIRIDGQRATDRIERALLIAFVEMGARGSQLCLKRVPAMSGVHAGPAGLQDEIQPARAR